MTAKQQYIITIKQQCMLTVKQQYMKTVEKEAPMIKFNFCTEHGGSVFSKLDFEAIENRPIKFKIINT